MPKKTQSVDEFVEAMNAPDTELIGEIRKEIARSSPGLVEGIKWNAPSYSFKGNDIITFNFRSSVPAALIFHTGPKGKDTHTGKRLFTDSSPLGEWAADKRFVVKVQNSEWLKQNKAPLSDLIKRWVSFAETNFEYKD